jgi:NagD protein
MGLSAWPLRRVEALPSLLTHVDRPHLAQHPQVLGDLRLGYPERGHQVVHRALAAGEHVEDLSPPGLGHGVERSAVVAARATVAGSDRRRRIVSAPMGGRTITSWLMDMDGVLVSEEHAIPGAAEFIGRLRELEIPFLVITNNSMYTRRDLRARLGRSGLDLPEEAIWTSALATAGFLDDQRPNGSAFVVGEAGLTTALHGHGYVITDRDPDYVVLGETRTYSFERITRAIRLVADGARFIATNPDNVGPSREGPLPATGSVAALISRATGVAPYYVGKPNPLMMRSALNALEAHSDATAMIGDRMDTDIVAGLEAGMETVLVLTGVTSREDAERHPYRPTRIVDSVADLVAELG